MVTCRIDISYAVIKLSQYSTRPARIHFEAIQTVYKYLKHTKHRGIVYHRLHSNLELPVGKLNVNLKADVTYQPTQERTHEPDHAVCNVDSDFASDHQHRKSVSGIVIMLSGAAILYKTKFQDVIAQSSTEAEFIAAAEAGRNILYVRSLLQEIGLKQ